jgi:lactate racemase
MSGADTIQKDMVFDLPWAHARATLNVADMPACAPLEEALLRALHRPIGRDASVLDSVRTGDSVTIVVSDAFRKTGVHLLLPVLIEELNARGIDDNDIAFLFATGSHRHPRPDEQAAILGEAIYRRFTRRAWPHDPYDDANLVYLGTTRRGTSVRINRRALECDRLILTGAVALHYFGGFGGGRKSVVPGLAGIDTIAQNHAMNLDPHQDRLNPAVRIGAMDGNPVAEDMLEAARMAPVHAIINTLLNRRGEIAQLFVGELEQAHRAAATAAYNAFASPIAARADFVIAASLETKNFVQTHKALFNAYQCIKPGGLVVLIAPCPEGLGGEAFVKWLRLGSPEAIIRGLRERAEINGQTALSTLQKAPQCLMVTEMLEEEVHALHAVKAPSLDDAFTRVREHFEARGQQDPSYFVLPHAACTVPFVDQHGA